MRLNPKQRSFLMPVVFSVLFAWIGLLVTSVLPIWSVSAGGWKTKSDPSERGVLWIGVKNWWALFHDQPLADFDDRIMREFYHNLRVAMIALALGALVGHLVYQLSRDGRIPGQRPLKESEHPPQKK